MIGTRFHLEFLLMKCQCNVQEDASVVLCLTHVLLFLRYGIIGMSNKG